MWASFIFGAGIMVLNMLFRSSFPTIMQSPINCGVVAMLAGLVIVLLLLVKKIAELFETVKTVFGI